MTDSRVTLARGTAVISAGMLVLAGASATYLFMRADAAGGSGVAETRAPEAVATPPPMAAPSTAISPSPGGTPLPDVAVTLAPESISRAGLVVTPVGTSSRVGALRLPGVIQPNAYRQVAVTPVVGGRVTNVAVQLGDRVSRGQAMAQIHSPDLAEAQTKYLTARAMLEAHDRELQRTQKLAAIGAASGQELERIHAEHAAQTATVQSARSQLELLGLPASAIDAIGSGSAVTATITVPAPLDAVVTERIANTGLNVDPGTRLFTVVDLSTVWVVADVYERDFPRVRLGTDATIAVAAYPDLALRGRVSYIDPEVNPETRTARVRLELPNPRHHLRLGMYADVVIADSAPGQILTIPRTAVQHVGDRTVVYVANATAPGQFIEREIRTGQPSGEQVEVIAGLDPGDLVVTAGRFFVRAERERLGLRPAGASDGVAQGNAKPQRAKVTVSEKGFDPDKLTLRPGVPAEITFVRTTDKTCATEVVFPSLKIKRALPLNEPVAIEFTPAKSGEIAFACGMNMFRGIVVIEAP